MFREVTTALEGDDTQPPIRDKGHDGCSEAVPSRAHLRGSAKSRLRPSNCADAVLIMI
jgi:hypothetical protein